MFSNVKYILKYLKKKMIIKQNKQQKNDDH